MAKKMNPLDYIAYILLVIGGLNWGITAIFGKDLFALIFGLSTSTPIIILVRIIYGLVGISAIYAIYTLIKLSK